MGLGFTRARWTDLERHIILAAKEFGYPDAEVFIQWLLSSKIDQSQVEMLASYLTIGETYFWREAQVFEALRAQILPELIRVREQGDKRLRIWSAGCSSGEEPYSIAIALREVLPDWLDWNITLLATDINPHILRRAATGVYGAWSFRNVPGHFKEKYFHPVRGNKFEILAEIRSMVQFKYFNLAEDVYPSPMNNTNAMDIIFCRNVLMYFLPERAQPVVQRLHQSLVEGGWLMVGASELSQQLFAQFSSTSFPGAIVYRRDGHKTRLPVIRAPVSIPVKSLPSRPAIQTNPNVWQPLPPSKARQADIPAASENLQKHAGAAAPADAMLTVRALANQGRLSEAWSACQMALNADKLNPGLYYLGATILQEKDQANEAIASLKQALYLDPSFILAHFALGNLAQRQGNAAAARKSMTNALSLLEDLDPRESVPEAEGLTAGRLKEIIHVTLQTGALV